MCEYDCVCEYEKSVCLNEWESLTSERKCVSVCCVKERHRQSSVHGVCVCVCVKREREGERSIHIGWDKF